MNTIIPNLSEEFLSSLNITTREVIETIENSIFASEKSEAWSAPKAVILPPDGRYMMAALAASNDPPLLVVKTVVLNPDNPNHGLPQINGMVTILNSETGIPIATMDGNWITAVRTAGLSAVAAKYLASEDANVAGFIGCGVQAISHLEAFAEIYPLREVRIFGRGKKNILNLRKQAEALGLNAIICTTAKQVLEGSDLIVTSVTFSSGLEPFLDANWLKPCSFAAVTDLGLPWIDESFAALDHIVIDDLEQEAALPNKLLSPEFVDADLAQLVLKKHDGRSSRHDRTAFVFRGHALGDLALADLALKKAKEGGHINW